MRDTIENIGNNSGIYIISRQSQRIGHRISDKVVSPLWPLNEDQFLIICLICQKKDPVTCHSIIKIVYFVLNNLNHVSITNSRCGQNPNVTTLISKLSEFGWRQKRV